MSTNAKEESQIDHSKGVEFVPGWTAESFFAGGAYFHEGMCKGKFCVSSSTRDGCFKYACAGCGRGTNRVMAKNCPTEACKEKREKKRKQNSKDDISKYAIKMY